MGCGTWTTSSFADYSTSLGRGVDAKGVLNTDYSAQDLFKSRHLNNELNPFNVIRECCNSEDHPQAFPVILGLDVTGSMGASAVEVAKKLNELMTKLYTKVKDIQFLIMGIGDLAYDSAPIQTSQFESDIRIAEQLDKIWFEGGGGGNNYESYTAAWFFGLRQTKLDCWNFNKRGLIITMGDELLNPYLPHRPLSNATGINLQGNVETKDLYNDTIQKYEIYHIDVKHSRYYDNSEENVKSFSKVLGNDHVKVSTVNQIVETITEIISNYYENEFNKNNSVQHMPKTNNDISW